MAQLGLRNFCNLAFLQEVDKPGVLAKLLAPHAAHFVGIGLDTARLANDHGTAKALLAAFTREDVPRPGPLLHALYMVDALADEAGHERIMEEARRLGIDLSSLGPELSPGNFAIMAYVRHPRLIEICHEKTVTQNIKRYYEFHSTGPRRLTLTLIESGRKAIESQLGAWFETRRRSNVCEIFAYPDGKEIRIILTHGALFRTAGAIVAGRQRSRIGWRPERHDSLLYDTKSGVLRIHAQFPAERETYARIFGEVLCGNPDFFRRSAPYTLERLRHNGGRLALVPGLSGARLTEARIAVDDLGCREMILKGSDLTPLIAGVSEASVLPGEITFGTFALDLSDGGRGCKLEIRLPNGADFDRDRHGPLVKAFIEANKFLIPESFADAVLDGVLEPV